MPRFLPRLPLPIIALAGLLLVAWIALRGWGADAEARAYAEDSVTAITRNWTADTLLARASPTLRANNDTARINELFDWLGTLGPLQANNGCATQSLRAQNFNSATELTARFLCTARYANGAATITLTVQHAGGAWMVSGFSVNSPALVPGKRLERL